MCSQAAKQPLIIVGAGVLRRGDRDAIMTTLNSVVEKAGNVVQDSWNGFNILHDSAGAVAALDLGFLPGHKALQSKVRIPRGRWLELQQAGAWACLFSDLLMTQASPKFVYLLASDEYDESMIPSDAFVVYQVPAATHVVYGSLSGVFLRSERDCSPLRILCSQGHHGDKGAARADVILPGAAYVEKNGTFVNTEGRVQRAAAAVPVPGQAREDWKIIRALSEVVNL